MVSFRSSNDNSAVRNRYMGADYNGPMVRLIKYIPLARKLIRRYCQFSWKHAPEHIEYAFLEYQICTLLEHEDYTRSHRQLKLRSLARVLYQEPLVLYNDPHLPF